MSGSVTISMSGVPARLKSMVELVSKWVDLGDVLLEVDAGQGDALAGFGDRPSACPSGSSGRRAGRRRRCIAADRTGSAGSSSACPGRSSSCGPTSRLAASGSPSMSPASTVPLDRGAVEDRHGAGQAEADRASIGVRVGAIFCRAGAEHLAAGIELAVDFESDGDKVIHLAICLVVELREWLGGRVFFWSAGFGGASASGLRRRFFPGAPEAARDPFAHLRLLSRSAREESIFQVAADVDGFQPLGEA